MVKKRRTGFRGVGRDNNAERVVLYTVLGSLLLFTPAVRVIANTTYERIVTIDQVAAPPVEAEIPLVATPRNDVPPAELEAEQPVPAPQTVDQEP